MAVEFEFQVTKNFHFFTAFAKHFNTIVDHDKVHLPLWLGDGYIQHIMLDGMALFIHNYKLNHDLVPKRQAIALLTFSARELEGHSVRIYRCNRTITMAIHGK